MHAYQNTRLFKLLFPEQTRDFKAKRWIKIALRTVHLVGIAGIAGSFISDSFSESWLLYLHLTIFSGITMMLLDIWSNGIWLLQLRGIAVLLKTALFTALLLTDQHNAIIFISIIVISGVIAHAPGDVRYYSIFHRKRIGALCKATK